MSFAAFMSAVYALNSKGIKRWAYLLLTILATCNVLLMTQGRTGYIVIVALALYLALTVSKRNSILFLLTLAVAFASFTYLPSSSMKSRIELGIHEGQAWRSSSQESHTTSIGQRMDFYKNTLEIIKKNYPEVITGVIKFFDKNNYFKATLKTDAGIEYILWPAQPKSVYESFGAKDGGRVQVNGKPLEDGKLNWALMKPI